MRAIRKNTESAKELIQYNKEVLYHIPAQYKNLLYYIDPKQNKRNIPLRTTLFKILGNCKKRDLILVWHNMYVCAMSNDYLTEEVRGKTTKEVSNHHFNLLCAMRLLRKLTQTEQHQLKINERLKEKYPNQHPINVFSVQRYTPDLLDLIEERCWRLRKAHVTSGNISSDKLILRGCEDLAAETYWSNSKESAERRAKEYELITDRMEKVIDIQGYLRKEDLYSNTPELEDKEIDKIFQIYSDEIWSEPEYAKFNYKSPNKAERERFNITEPEYLKKWIFYPNLTKRKEKEIELMARSTGAERERTRKINADGKKFMENPGQYEISDKDGNLLEIRENERFVPVYGKLNKEGNGYVGGDTLTGYYISNYGNLVSYGDTTANRNKKTGKIDVEIKRTWIKGNLEDPEHPESSYVKFGKNYYMERAVWFSFAYDSIINDNLKKFPKMKISIEKDEYEKIKEYDNKQFLKYLFDEKLEVGSRNVSRFEAHHIEDNVRENVLKNIELLEHGEHHEGHKVKDSLEREFGGNLTLEMFPEFAVLIDKEPPKETYWTYKDYKVIPMTRESAANLLGNNLSEEDRNLLKCGISQAIEAGYRGNTPININDKDYGCYMIESLK